MILLGIDPGLATTGFAFLEKDNREVTLLDFGILRTLPSMPLGERLTIIREDLQQLIDKYQPAAAGIEELFFSTNTKTALTVAHARGVLLETLSRNNLEIHEFTPPEVKSAVTGDGRADKKQIQDMVRMILGVQISPTFDDAADAVAVALCLAGFVR